MAINIEGAIRGDDPRIPKVESLNGVTVLGFLNGKVVSIDATLMDLIDITTNKFQVVAELPASPVTGVFYFVKE